MKKRVGEECINKGLKPLLKRFHRKLRNLAVTVNDCFFTYMGVDKIQKLALKNPDVLVWMFI